MVSSIKCRSLSLRMPSKFSLTCERLYSSTRSPISYCERILLFLGSGCAVFGDLLGASGMENCSFYGGACFSRLSLLSLLSLESLRDLLFSV